ncbi:MAG TPA: sulfite exporter TauE/SafE family protein [Burkholderiaceae bacterium]
MLEWIQLPGASLGIAALIIVWAYIVYGLTGFGSSITALPLLVQFIPLREAVPLILVFDLFVGVLMGLNNRRVIDRGEVKRLLPFMLAGMVLGVTLLVSVPERALLILLGVFVLAYSAWSLVLRPEVKPLSSRWAGAFGTFGGVFTALFGTGGPIYTIYLARRLPDKTVLRATISGLLFLSALARLVLFTGAGLYAQPQVLPLAAVLLPCALLGLYLGNHLHHRLPQQRVVQLVWVILVVGGAGLMWRGIVGR